MIHLYMQYVNPLYADDHYSGHLPKMNFNGSCSLTRLILRNVRTSLDTFVLSFRNYLELFRPCISQCTGFN